MWHGKHLTHEKSVKARICTMPLTATLSTSRALNALARAALAARYAISVTTRRDNMPQQYRARRSMAKMVAAARRKIISGVSATIEPAIAINWRNARSARRRKNISSCSAMGAAALHQHSSWRSGEMA